MSDPKVKLGKKEVYGIVIAALALFFLLKFGVVGVRLFVGLVVIFFLPFYLIMSAFPFSDEERLLFTIFLSFGGVPSIVYGLGFVLNSILLAIIGSFILLTGLGLWLRKRKLRVSEHR